MATKVITRTGDTFNTTQRFTFTYSTSSTGNTYTFTLTKVTAYITISNASLWPEGSSLISLMSAIFRINKTDYLDVTMTKYSVSKSELGKELTLWSGSKGVTIKKSKTTTQDFYIDSFSLPKSTTTFVTIPKTTSYSITYDANGGTGAPAKQTKWHAENITLSSTKPTRSGYVFKIWNTAKNGSGTNYTPGKSYTTNANLTLYAQWNQNHTVTYNANGGSSAPAKQEKVYGTALKLATTQPSRSGFKFMKWNTKANGTGTNYSPGATYSTEANLTLYAIWEAIPTISSLTCYRCNSSGTQNDEGTYGYVNCVWSMSGAGGESATVTGTITPQYGGSAKSFTFRSGASGTGGTATAIIGPSNGMALDIDMQYTIAITITNKSQKATRNNIITRAFFVMDWKAGGQAIGIGRAAPQTGLEVGYVAHFDDNLNFYKRLICPSNRETGSWWQARDVSKMALTDHGNDNMAPMIDAKTKTGDWCIATYQNNLYIAYVPDSSYTGKTNTGTKQFSFLSDGTARINIPADNVTSGTFSADRIPSLDASKINAGTFGAARIPSLNASKINAGTFADDRIPDGILRKSELVGQTFNKTGLSVSASNYLANQTLNVTKSGYTAIGLLGVWCTGTGASFALPYSTYLDGNTVKFSIRNLGTSAASLNFYARVLYKES